MKTLLASTVLGLVVTGTAHADMFAYAKTHLTNFVILGSDGNPLDYDTDFGTISFTSSADMDGSLGGGSYNYNVPNSTSGTDFAVDCLGDCPVLTENKFNDTAWAPLLTGAQGLDYVTSDQLEAGSPLANAPNFNPTAGADIGAITVGSLSATSQTGSANVNNGLEATWTFTLNQDTGGTFAGNVETYLEAFASSGEDAPGKASAATTFTITVTDLSNGIVVYSFLRDDPLVAGILNQTTSANANNWPFDIQTCGDFAGIFGSCGTALSTAFSSTTVALAAGIPYQVSMRLNTNIDIARVPEPGILGLLGLGLLGGFFARRRHARMTR